MPSVTAIPVAEHPQQHRELPPGEGAPAADDPEHEQDHDEQPRQHRRQRSGPAVPSGPAGNAPDRRADQPRPRNRGSSATTARAAAASENTDSATTTRKVTSQTSADRRGGDQAVGHQQLRPGPQRARTAAPARPPPRTSPGPGATTAFEPVRPVDVPQPTAARPCPPTAARHTARPAVTTCVPRGPGRIPHGARRLVRHGWSLQVSKDQSPANSSTPNRSASGYRPLLLSVRSGVSRVRTVVEVPVDHLGVAECPTRPGAARSRSPPRTGGRRARTVPSSSRIVVLSWVASTDPAVERLQGVDRPA